MPAGVWGMTQNSGVGYCTGTFQTPANMTQFRFVIFCANASSNAITILVDDFTVGPQTAPFGPAYGDWQTYSVTVTATTTNPTKSGSPVMDQGYWRRVGDSIEIRYDYEHSVAGSAGSGTYLFSLPSGLTIDTTKAAVGATDRVVGTAYGYNGSYESVGSVLPYDSQHVAMNISTANGAMGWVGSGVNGFGGTTCRLHFMASLPIAGFSSNCQMSQDTDTRVCAAFVSASTASGSINTSYNTVTYGAATNDTHGAWNGTNTYTAPISGYYDLAASIYYTCASASGAYDSISFLVNGTTRYAENVTRNSVANPHSLSTTIKALKLNAGDQVVVQTQINSTTPAFSTGSASNFFSITRVTGPAVVAATEQVACSYSTAAGQSLGTSPGAVTYGTKNYDTHNAYSGSTFTAPVSGKYRVAAQIQTATVTLPTTGYVACYVYKNGSQLAENYMLGNAASNNYAAAIYYEVSLNAGDTIQIYGNCSTATTLNTTANLNFMSISKI